MSTLRDQAERDVVRQALDETLVVEAAAGTGKTSELVRRMVAIIASGRARVHEMVAVTFTEKAAGELKLRLRAELERERRGTEPGDERRGRLEHALARLEEARVGTIHGFCGDLLRERSVDAGVDPEFETMAEPEARRCFQEAFDLWLQQALEDPPPGVRRSLRRVAHRPRRPLGPRFENDRDEDGPVSRLARAAWQLAEWRDFRTPWRRDPFEREAEIDALVERIRALAELTARCSKPEKDHLYFDTEPIRRFATELGVSDEASIDRDYDALEAALVELCSRSRDWMRRTGYGKLYAEDVTRQTVIEARATLLERLTEFRTEADADLAALLQQELLEAVDRYDEAKRKLGRVDFMDLLLRARDLVRGDPGVREDYQRRFSHIFIDEFQDTDPLQAEILLLLSSDDPDESSWREVRPSPGKLFVVGDPKQAIYRFRRADVGTYLDVKEQLVRHGARVVELSTSFRSVPMVQQAVNVAFGQVMQENRDAFQAGYVPLTPHREDSPDQPAVIALPVPHPHGARGGVTKTAIQASLPDAVGAFVEWVIEDSGWTVTERGGGPRVPIAARHVCLLFRRLHGMFEGDVTGGYIDALEARDVKHLIVGGRAFHDKEEVETLRTALTAIEWPDDELAVFATLRGPFFAVGDDALLEYRATRGGGGGGSRRLHPHRIPPRDDVPERLYPILTALEVLRSLHRARNRRPISDTIADLLERTRAHAGLALRRAGEQALANVLHVADQARRYESTGGISFRGFVERLIEEAAEGRTPEAPILEDGSDGVRLMTVHKAKGLEFPVVILADMTASIGSRQASRHVDPEKGLAAMRVGGWLPKELHENGPVEIERDLAEGIRLAYVAATRARDVLVVPATGEGPGASGRVEDAKGQANWFAPLNAAIFPPPERWRAASAAAGTPKLGKESVIRDDDPTIVPTPCVAPGRHTMGALEVVWWDPHVLRLGRRVGAGVRRDLERLIAKDSPPAAIEAGRKDYETWRDRRERVIRSGSAPSLEVVVATARAREQRESEVTDPRAETIELVVLDVDRAARPGGKRFGALAHAILASVPIGGTRAEVSKVAELEARILGATPGERDAAIELVARALEHALFERVRRADEMRREVPVSTMREGVVIDGVIDLAFREGEAWTIVDFKTDSVIEDLDLYRLQVLAYVDAVADAEVPIAGGVILHV
jgi:ATP-dependent exoDNAse (exonuclease V) beta subunit